MLPDRPACADIAPEKFRKLLRFVQRGRILLRCGRALALSLPSLGVSSLDLGRLFIQAALFLLWRVISEARDTRDREMRDCTSMRICEHSRFGASRARNDGMSAQSYSAAAWNGPRSPSGTCGQRVGERGEIGGHLRKPRRCARAAARPCRSRG